MSHKAPHKAVVLIKVEVHDIMAKTGECSGNPVPPDKLAEYGLKPTSMFSVDGQDLDDCLRKLKERISSFE
jgi:hypothetical protein